MTLERTPTTSVQQFTNFYQTFQAWKSQVTDDMLYKIKRENVLSFSSNQQRPTDFTRVWLKSANVRE